MEAEVGKRRQSRVRLLKTLRTKIKSFKKNNQGRNKAKAQRKKGLQRDTKKPDSNLVA